MKILLARSYQNNSEALKHIFLHFSCQKKILNLQSIMAGVLGNRGNTPETSLIQVRKLVQDAKTYASEGELHKSLRNFKKAYQLRPTEKIMSRIKRIEELLAEDEEGSDDDYGFVELDNGLVIYKKLVERLYPHQINGIKWMYNLFKAGKKGGILADDMGLGKTIQVIAFISAMFDMKKAKNILLVIPLSVIPNWVSEFEKWAPGIKIECFHGASNKRKAVLQQCMRKRSVCITTYGLIVTQWQALGETLHGTEFVWDYIILDEGHRIKNPSKTTKRLHSIPARNRMILTGTPVQNKVRDLWALMDWITQGSLLGTQKTFKSNYEQPIERARQRDACAAEIQLGNSMAESLRKLTEPYILRRTKAMLSAADKENLCPDQNLKNRMVDDAQDNMTISKQPVFPKLSTKNDFVVWVYLSEVQQNIYKDFLELDSVKELLTSHRSPLVHLTIIKKICDHPRLLSTKACIELGLQTNNESINTDLNSSAIEDCAANRIDNISDKMLMEESGKLQFLIELLLQLREEGHRTLVFSMSRKMLNIIQRILINHRFKIMRLDGRVTKMAERQIRVKKFQEDPTYNIFLLTTQVGGVGLTLTAADRVVIYDPAWNPATDDQAIDRIYRIGQKKSVAVYRLITCGTVEEKIYRRQIFKNSVIQQSVQGAKDPYRYFTSQELRDLFILDDVHSSNTQIQLKALHGHQRNVDAKLQTHLDYLHTLATMFGISDHDLMFSCKPDDFDYDNEMSNDLFENKVEAAHKQLLMEANQLNGQSEPELRWGAFSNEKKETSPKNDENEPVYPIEGLSDKFEELQFKSEFDADDDLPTIKKEKHDPALDRWNLTTEKIKMQQPSSSTVTPSPLNVPEGDDDTDDSAYNDEDDNVIILGDSPVSQPPFKTFIKTPAKLVKHGDEKEVLAPNTPTIVDDQQPQFPQYSGNAEMTNPTVIEDSFVDNNFSDEEPDENWKKIFSKSTPNLKSARKSVASLHSFHDSPLVASSSRKQQRIVSDDEDESSASSEDELPIDLHSTSNHLRTSHGEDDVCNASSFERFNENTSHPQTSAEGSNLADDVSVCENISYNDDASIHDEEPDVSLHEERDASNYDEEPDVSNYDEGPDVSNYDEGRDASNYDEERDVSNYDEERGASTHDEERDVSNYDEELDVSIHDEQLDVSIHDEERDISNYDEEHNGHVNEVHSSEEVVDSDATDEYYQEQGSSDDEIQFNLSGTSEDEF